MTDAGHRGTICLEDAEILAQTAYAGGQYVLEIRAPRAARRAVPGSFAHIGCGAEVRLRRPLSIMRADPDAGTLEFLYKVVGPGLAKLAQRKPGEVLSVLAPIGRGFAPDPRRPEIVALGGGVGMPPIVFMAERRTGDAAFAPPLVLMGSEVPFPFETVPARAPAPDLPPSATHALARLEARGIPSRLASNAALPGAFRGFVTDLARARLEARGPEGRAAVQLLACGPEPMLHAAARLAAEFERPVPACGRGVHGLRRRRLRGLHGARADGFGAGHETRLRRWARVRGARGVPRAVRRRRLGKESRAGV